MARIHVVDPSQADGYAARIFELQTEKWGAPLELFARVARPRKFS